MSFIALAYLALLPQEDNGEGLYRFQPGTTWVYSEVQREPKGETRKRSVMEAKKFEDGKTEIEEKEYEGEATEPTQVKTVYSYLEDGYVCWGKMVEEKLTADLRVFKVGAKKGDTWTFGEGKRVVQLTHMGTADVTVKAGSYKDALYVQMSFGDKKTSGTADFYFVSGIGLVKGEMKMGDLVANQIELQEFKAAK